MPKVKYSSTTCNQGPSFVVQHCEKLCGVLNSYLHSIFV